MRIAITGAAGFIGLHLVRHLVRQNVPVGAFIQAEKGNSSASAQRYDDLEKILREQPQSRSYYCQSFGELDTNFAHFQPTCCVHLAGRSSVRESLQNPLLYAETNSGLTIKVLEAARRSNCHRVIFASSVMVYGKDAPLPYCESRLGSTPASFYGASKLAAETLLNCWRALNGMQTMNLRFFSVYGPGLREDCAPHLIASAISNDAEFSIFGTGSSNRDYIEIGDVIDALDLAMRTQWRSDFPTALNIGSGRATSLLRLVELIEKGMGKNARRVFKPANKEELHSVAADVSTAKAALGWAPKVELETGIQRFTDWFKAQSQEQQWKS